MFATPHNHIKRNSRQPTKQISTANDRERPTLRGWQILRYKGQRADT
jgi:hypothetical protein